MPQPFRPKQGQKMTGGTGRLHEHPDVMLAVCAIIQSSVFLEEQLADLAGIASATHAGPVSINTAGGQAIGARTNLVAAAAMDALETMFARLAVIRAILSVSVSSDLQKVFGKLAVALGKANKGRNAIVHSSWRFCDAYPGDLFVVSGHNEYVRYTAADLKQIQARLHNAAFAVAQFSTACLTERASNPDVPAPPGGMAKLRPDVPE